MNEKYIRGEGSQGVTVCRIWEGKSKSAPGERESSRDLLRSSQVLGSVLI